MNAKYNILYCGYLKNKNYLNNFYLFVIRIHFIINFNYDHLFYCKI